MLQKTKLEPNKFSAIKKNFFCVPRIQKKNIKPIVFPFISCNHISLDVLQTYKTLQVYQLLEILITNCD